MGKREEIVESATRVFETGSFRGIGVDRVLASTGTSTRTMYKHFGSRDELVIAVLETRQATFMKRLADEADHADPIGSLFATQVRWMVEHEARGCLLLRARGEYAGASEEIVSLVRRQKQEFREVVSQRLKQAIEGSDDALATQIWLLFEGAVAAASVTDLSVFDAASEAAKFLMASAHASGA